MGRPALTIEQRWDKLRARLQLPNGDETELKELEKEERALSAQIKYKNNKKPTYNLPDVFEAHTLTASHEVIEWEGYYAVAHGTDILMDGMSKKDAEDYAAHLNKI